MKLAALLRSASLLATSALLGACSAAPSTAAAGGEGGEGAVTTNDGQALELRFEGVVVAEKSAVVKSAVLAQVQYLNGILTTDVEGNAEVGFVDITNVRETVEGDKKRISYTAAVPAIWPKGRTAPTSYDLALPLDTTDLEAFNAKYDGKCGKNEYGVETFWHDFNPKMRGCTMAAGDVHKVKATLRKNPLATTGKYPEYDQVWADDSLDIVVVYGAISNTSDTDSGATDREAFLNTVRSTVQNPVRKDAEPSGSIVKESTVDGDVTVAGKVRKVHATAYFVSELSSVGEDFDAKYGPVSEKADIVIYSGHSGLGKNIAGMAQKTRATKNKYQIVYLNGCQTLGYLQTTMHDRRRELNGADADPKGTKYLDVILNALPAYAEPVPTEQTLYRAMLTQSRSYNDLLKDFRQRHLVAVVGEDDNTFTPAR